MKLRITGGIFLNSRIKTPKGLSTRPTASIVRESVFNICRDKVKDCYFLDMFAGSGIMGIEAISRGGSFATFLDNDINALRCIKANIEKFSLQDKTEVIFSDYKRLSDGKSYDIIYVDPPYLYYEKSPSFIFELIQMLLNKKVFKKNAYLFLEEKYSKKRVNEPYQFNHLKHIFSRKYGSCLLNLYEFGIY